MVVSGSIWACAPLAIAQLPKHGAHQARRPVPMYIGIILRRHWTRGRYPLLSFTRIVANKTIRHAELVSAPHHKGLQ